MTLPTSAVLSISKSDVAYLGRVGRIMLKTGLRKKHKDAEAQKSRREADVSQEGFIALRRKQSANQRPW
jgi:hypothetical protein